jgi:aconitate hydratase 2/2-methylisocitrate dehydratase
MLGKIPTKEEYMANIGVIEKNAADIYRYMNFDQIKEFSEVAEEVQV